MGHIPSAVATLVAGLVSMTLVQMLAPVAAPLFDGVVVAEPYRYVVPPPGGANSPTSADDRVDVAGDLSPAFAVFTKETPPQAELLAHGGELAIRPDTRTLRVTIVPLAPSSTGSGTKIAGNVYRFTVTDQAGVALVIRAGETITLAMRGPQGVSAAAPIALLEHGSWHALPTGPSGLQDFLLTNATAFGEYAILGSIPVQPADESPALLIAAVVVAAVIVFFGWRLEVHQSSTPVTSTTARQRGRAPRGSRRR